jgi:hypothetical protein
MLCTGFLIGTRIGGVLAAAPPCYITVSSKLRFTLEIIGKDKIKRAGSPQSQSEFPTVL